MSKPLRYLPAAVSQQIAGKLGLPPSHQLTSGVRWNSRTVGAAMEAMILLDAGRPYLLRDHMTKFRKLLAASGAPSDLISECTTPAHNRLIFAQQLRRGMKPDYRPGPYSQPPPVPLAAAGPSDGDYGLSVGRGGKPRHVTRVYAGSGPLYSQSPSLDFDPSEMDDALEADLAYARSLEPGRLAAHGYPNHRPQEPSDGSSDEAEDDDSSPDYDELDLY